MKNALEGWHVFQPFADRINRKTDKFLDWICETCNGKYYDSIGNMVNGISICPYCSNKKVLPGFNDLITRHPNLIKEVYSIGNYLIGTDLSKCSDNCTKTAYWICVECDNIYPMKIVDRLIKKERGHNPCPRCNYVSKKKIFVF